MIVEQYNKQLIIDQDLIFESIDTLNIVFDADIDFYIPEVNLTRSDEFKEDAVDDDIDDIDNVSKLRKKYRSRRTFLIRNGKKNLLLLD